MRWLRRILIIFVVLGVALGLLLIYIGPTTPNWYQPPSPQDEQVVALADRVEYRLLEETRKIRDEEDPWTLRIRQEQINAWLSARLPAWIAHEQNTTWPDQLGTPQVRIDENRMLLALPIGPPDSRRVVVAQIDPKITKTQGLTLKLTAVRFGRLSVPGNPVAVMIDTIKRFGGDQVDEAALDSISDLLSGRRGIDPVLNLQDGRRVEIMSLSCRDGMVDLTSRTLSHEHKIVR